MEGSREEESEGWGEWGPSSFLPQPINQPACRLFSFAARGPAARRATRRLNHPENYVNVFFMFEYFILLLEDKLVRLFDTLL